MKSIVFILLFVLLPSTSYSQLPKLKIINQPEKISSEIVTTVDANGRYCSAVQIISNLTGFSYDAYNGVIKVDTKPGKDIVYISSNEQVLELFLAGYEPLKIYLSDLGIRLKPKEVWMLKVSGENRESDILPVSILVDQRDAEVFIDGKEMGKGPTYNLSKGKHTVKILKNEYKPFDQIILVDEKNTLFRFNLVKSIVVPVTIGSVPSSASIFFEGKLLSSTPFSFFKSIGKYNVNIKKEGYFDLNEVVDIKIPKQDLFYRLNKKDPNYAYLSINTHPDAKIKINGKYTKIIHLIKILPQIANVEVTVPNAEPISKQVVLKANNITTIDMFPKITKGTILVAVVPFRTNIKLIGLSGNEYTASTNHIFKDIPSGGYKLTIEKHGYESYTESIELEAGQKTIRNIKLNILDIPSGFAFIEGGMFSMGNTFNDKGYYSKTIHDVYVNDFIISKYETSFDEYDQFCVETGKSIKEDYNMGRGKKPVINISWYDAVEYCNWRSRKENLVSCYTINRQLKDINNKSKSDNIRWDVKCNFNSNGYRLPTEAEWEFAARNRGENIRYGNGKNIANPSELNYNCSAKFKESYSHLGTYRAKTVAIDSLLPSSVGLFNMSGNVAEWCWDWLDPDYYKKSALNNPSGPSEGEARSIRGGSFNRSPKYARTDSRFFYAPYYSNWAVGFRVVRSY